MEHSKFSFQLTPTNPIARLGFEAWVNDQCIFNTDHVHEESTITGYLPDDNQEAEHRLKFVLKNKQPEDTQLNDLGEIVQDACLQISNVVFDGIELGHMVNKLTVYQHDFNGTGELVKENFFGTMGCNGSAELKFTTPIYLWFLENL